MLQRGCAVHQILHPSKRQILRDANEPGDKANMGPWQLVNVDRETCDAGDGLPLRILNLAKLDCPRACIASKAGDAVLSAGVAGTELFILLGEGFHLCHQAC